MEAARAGMLHYGLIPCVLTDSMSDLGRHKAAQLLNQLGKAQSLHEMRRSS